MRLFPRHVLLKSSRHGVAHKIKRTPGSTKSHHFHCLPKVFLSVDDMFFIDGGHFGTVPLQPFYTRALSVHREVTLERQWGMHDTAHHGTAQHESTARHAQHKRTAQTHTTACTAQHAQHSMHSTTHHGTAQHQSQRVPLSLQQYISRLAFLYPLHAMSTEHCRLFNTVIGCIVSFGSLSRTSQCAKSYHCCVALVICLPVLCRCKVLGPVSGHRSSTWRAQGRMVQQM